MSNKVCRHCRRLISGQDYRVVGYETNDAQIPENVYVHTDCLIGYNAAQGRREHLQPMLARGV